MSILGKSIAWRLVLPIPTITILIVAAAWILVPAATTQNARDGAVAAALQTVNQFKTIRAYYTQNVIKKVLGSGALKPHFDHKHDPNAVPLPATVIHDLSALMAEQDTQLSLYSGYLFPNRADRTLDPFQQEAWDALSANPDEPFVREEVIAGQRVVRVAVADQLVAEGCVACHNNHPDTPKNDWSLGDVRGVLEVTSNIEPQLAAGAMLSRNTVIGAVIAGIVLLIATMAGSLSVVRPLKAMAGVMGRLADGDLETEVPALNSRNEIGAMARSVQVFKESGQEKVRLEAESKQAAAQAAAEKSETMRKLASDFEEGVGSVLSSVGSSAEQMKASATSMTSMADKASQRSSSVASAAEEATANVQTVATAAEEMAASVDEISRQVTQSADMAKSAVTSATETNAKVEGLADAAEKIGEVVELINDIAAQTNLLALNATIEASRAGEAGKGFAVVASEVKSLASQTAKATEEIGAQIAAIQAETKDAVEAIQGIGQVISEICDTATAIASAVEEQGAATREIAANVQQAASGTQDVSTNIVEVSRGAQETGSASQQILSAAEELGAQSDELQAAVASFLERVKAA
jgi:methyl-accepting chemotaxis protein